MKESLALLGEMAGGIAHEFKNSLATISGYAQMLEGESLPEELDLRLRMLRKEAARLAGTVNRLLSFVKPQELNRNVLDLRLLLQECMEEIRLDKRFKNVVFELEGGSFLFDGDESLLKSAFENLLLNAAESCLAKPDHGHVTCSLHGVVTDKSHKVVVKISDDGSGIEEEDREKIFIPFFSTKSEGSGLGLAIVQKIIFMHDGKIEVNSKTGQGTSFTILL
jgi:signal transduction histidine kinase